MNCHERGIPVLRGEVEVCSGKGQYDLLCSHNALRKHNVKSAGQMKISYTGQIRKLSIGGFSACKYLRFILPFKAAILCK